MASSFLPSGAQLWEYLYRARAAGVSWPVPDDMSDGDLERLLFPQIPNGTTGTIPQPDRAYVHTEDLRAGA